MSRCNEKGLVFGITIINTKEYAFVMLMQSSQIISCKIFDFLETNLNKTETTFK